jgi:hypothetical protein
MTTAAVMAKRNVNIAATRLMTLGVLKCNVNVNLIQKFTEDCVNHIPTFLFISY